MSNPIMAAIQQICDEKGLKKEQVIETIQAALAAAYRKDFGNKEQNIKVKFDPESGQMRVFDEKTVVEDMDLDEIERQRQELYAQREEWLQRKQKAEEAGEEFTELDPMEVADIKRFNPKTDIILSEAKKIKPDAEIGDIIVQELEIPAEFGRVAAQTAKQVIIQKLREIERETVFEEYKTKEHELVNGIIQRVEGRMVYVDLGKVLAVMPPEEQVPGEPYRPGSKYKVYIVSVERGSKGPEIVVSRSHPEVLAKMFTLEVPEIAAGTVEIKAIAREAGSRSKIAVVANQENIDPIGSCVGQRGTRVQTIINELGGEKIDIIEWSEDPAQFIANALSPAQVLAVEIDEKEKKAVATVKEDQLSLAIGKAGQNVRLAAKLTGWKIDIASEQGKIVEATSAEGKAKDENKKQKDEQIETEGQTTKSLSSDDKMEDEKDKTEQTEGEQASKEEGEQEGEQEQDKEKSNKENN